MDESNGTAILLKLVSDQQQQAPRVRFVDDDKAVLLPISTQSNTYDDFTGIILTTV